MRNRANRIIGRLCPSGEAARKGHGSMRSMRSRPRLGCRALPMPGRETKGRRPCQRPSPWGHLPPPSCREYGRTACSGSTGGAGSAAARDSFPAQAAQSFTQEAYEAYVGRTCRGAGQQGMGSRTPRIVGAGRPTQSFPHQAYDACVGQTCRWGCPGDRQAGCRGRDLTLPLPRPAFGAGRPQRRSW